MRTLALVPRPISQSTGVSARLQLVTRDTQSLHMHFSIASPVFFVFSFGDLALARSHQLYLLQVTTFVALRLRYTIQMETGILTSTFVRIFGSQIQSSFRLLHVAWWYAASRFQ